MQIHIPVDPEVLVPLDYWKPEAEFPPDIEGATERYAQFTTYGKLSRGDFNDILPQWLENDPVQANYFATIPDSRTRFMMQYPPEVAVDDDALMDEFIDAMHDMLYNFSVYGTGLFYVYHDGAPHIESINPINWYPSDDGDALVWEMQDRYEVHILSEDENLRLVFERNNETNRLGDLIESESFPPLAARPLFPCANRPKRGEWGYSLIPKIAPLVKELTKLYTHISEIHERSASPFLVVEGGDGTDIDKLNARARGDTRGTRIERTAAMLQGQRRSGWVTQVSGKLTPIPTLADTEDMRNQAKELKAEIFVHSATPANFLGAQDGLSSAAVSGESIRKANAYAESWIVSTQEEVSRCANNALQLATGQQNLEITWRNPFEEMDVQREPNNLRNDDEGNGVGRPPSSVAAD